MTETAQTSATAGPSSGSCPVCGSVTEPVVSTPDIPVHVGVLWPTADAARHATKGVVQLSFCRSCGLVHNASFDPSLVDYEQEYDNALHASAVFRGFEASLAERLVSRYGLQDGNVVEVGCGDGHFLGVLSALGVGEATGFDPSHDPRLLDPAAAGRVRVVPAEFDSGAVEGAIDLLCSRQVLEHIPQPVEFLSSLRRGSGPDTVLYVEVPNARMLLGDLSIWDMVYEHCLYFTEESLRYAMEVAGFEVLEIRTDYEDQFLAAEARPGPSEATPLDLTELEELVGEFGRHYRERRQGWRERLARFAADGVKTVGWGGGARAIGFFNILEVGTEIDCVVDLNPRKQGTHLAGTGHPIVAPDHLEAIGPDVVVVFNPIYVQEITASLNDMGLRPKVITA